jgi:hypothetical protein
MNIGLGMSQYQSYLAKARHQNLVSSDSLGIDGWKPATKATLAHLSQKQRRKEKTKVRKKDRKVKQTSQTDFYMFVTLVRETGKFDKLIPYCVDGLTIKSILEWHEQEQWDRQFKAIKAMNGG